MGVVDGMAMRVVDGRPREWRWMITRGMVEKRVAPKSGKIWHFVTTCRCVLPVVVAHVQKGVACRARS